MFCVCVLEREPGDLAGIVRAMRARKVQVALGVEECGDN